MAPFAPSYSVFLGKIIMSFDVKYGGALLMDCLIALGGTKGFGVPGESYLAVLDAMYDRMGKLI